MYPLYKPDYLHVWFYFLYEGVSISYGWRHIGYHWYYLMPGGKMAVGWCVVDSNWYYFDTNGVWAN